MTNDDGGHSGSAHDTNPPWTIWALCVWGGGWVLVGRGGGLGSQVPQHMYLKMIPSSH